MAEKATMINSATINTMGLKSLLFISMVARLYHPEVRLMTIGTVISKPAGIPTSNCRESFFLLRRLASQYRIKSVSSFVIIAAFDGSIRPYAPQSYGEVHQKLYLYPIAKSDCVKLPQLLSQYLYQHRKLDLPGIGSFTLDAGAVIPQESDRIGQVPATGIAFKNANIALADDVLITYIKEHTGKMKSLAAADLDFYLTTGRQLLNIGKPFYLDGIGTLLKNKEGLLEFTPGDYLVARLEDHHHDRRTTAGHEEETREESRNTNSRQTLLLVGLIAGLIVIGWGGYYLYKRNNFVEPTSENRATVIPDTTAARRVDSTTVARTAVDTNTAARNASAAVLEKKDTARVDATAQKP